MEFIPKGFDGLIPKLEPRTLGRTQAQVAENVDLREGHLGAIEEPSLVQNLSADTIRVYNWNSSWLEWSTDVNVVENPIANDAYDRIHLTGSGTPKVYGVVASVEYKLDLGVPKPTKTPLATAVQKAATVWTRTWRYQYEDPTNGTIYQEAVLVEGTDVIEVISGKQYTLATLPTRIAGTPASARFILWASGTDQYGSDLGRVYPDISSYANDKRYPGNSDLFVDGAQVTGGQYTRSGSPNVTFNFVYGTSRASEYKVERAYVYTFKSIFGEEGPPSEPSVIKAVDPSQDCTVSNFDTSVVGNYNITTVTVYRTVTDENGHAAYQYVTEFDIGGSSYLDELPNSSTGEILQTTGWVAPPADLAGMDVHGSGAAVGFSGNDLYFSVPFYLHAWKVNFIQSMKAPIVSIGVSDTTVIVATTKGIQVVTGSHPDSMSIDDGNMQQPCKNKLSMVNVNGTIVYACPDGLVGYQGHDGAMLTNNYYTEIQWADINPGSMFGTVHDQQYFAWTSSDSIIFDFQESRDALTTTTVTPVAVYSDIPNDKLYLIVDNATSGNRELQLWRGGSTNLKLRWKGRLLQLGQPEDPLFCRTVADSYTSIDDVRSDDDITLNIYAKTVLVKTVILYDDAARWVPELRREKTWEFEVTAKVDVHGLGIAASMKKLKAITNE